MKAPQGDTLRAAIDRLRIVDSYGIEWSNILSDKDTDPRMLRDVVLAVRALLDLDEWMRTQKMALERLTFEEGMMREINEVIRTGVEIVAPLRKETEDLLTEWCDSGEEYARSSDSRHEDER